jgi:hypothetical protein
MHICSTARRVLDADGSPIASTKGTHCLSSTRFIAAVLVMIAATGCSVYQHYEDSKPENVRKTEAMLAEAGFTTIKLDSDDKVGLVEELPPYELRSYAVQSGTVYWYYDPDICACVYEGHQGDFDRYLAAQRQESDTAQYAAQSSDQQVASLNALNAGFFPPPLFWISGYPPPPPPPRVGGHGGGHGHFGGGFPGGGFGGGHGGGHGR